ncbi:class I SAM-dependent methyltransferase [[Mycobacterium] wendilense]|uniref:S-adenosyl-L-methionine-dependent methyltransferase n=1 Tax=[Mycobacterium] wendilense TaxID=3064284 RepID=A0ABN9P1W8_9MYCO|nr:class I SAM-dependent methyltransferase [Mycolicibacterium sp. MU0050]CAJ1585238.1 class I SAM-dependent methyltransferase [Mycolicibacterium sp. MU0050]
MARTGDDSWDLASSVGATATMVAAGRAFASRDPDPLIDDPFAEPLVRAVGLEFFSRMLDGDLDMSQLPDASPERVQAMIDGMAVRTKFFDDYFHDAVGTGIRQAVILASGLDARAYRLEWAPGTVVYEVDQPRVIEFKSTTLAGLGAAPTAERRTVGIDLREDWPTALRAAGFDPAAPTAWLAEGLLIYLPPEAQDRLFDLITALSARGSTVATEYAPGIIDFDADQARELSAPLREHGLDVDMPTLVYPGQRSHVMDYLAGLGWRVDGVPRDDLFARYRRPAPVDSIDPLGEIVYVSATLT